MKTWILQQYDYHVWANRKVCEYLQVLSEEVYRKEIVSVFPSIYDTMVHIYVIDSGWLSFFNAGGVTDMSPAYLENLKESIDRLVAETEGKRIEELGQLMAELAVRFRLLLSCMRIWKPSILPETLRPTVWIISSIWSVTDRTTEGM